MITRDDLHDGSRHLLDTGQIAITEDCILRRQPDGKYVREDFAEHLAEVATSSPKRSRVEQSADTDAVQSDD